MQKFHREIFDPKGLNAIETGEKYQIKLSSSFHSDGTSIMAWKSTGFQKIVEVKPKKNHR